MSGRVVLACCGEASGDLLLSGVVRALKAAEPGLRVVGLGGVRCREAGMETMWDVSELSVMGIAEVLPKLRKILKLMDEVADFARETRPVAALLVDAPDFNLRLAKGLRRHGIPVVQYVSPTVWAWRPGRVTTIAARVDKLACILPFEEAWLRARGVDATFVGHPLLEQEPSAADVAALKASWGGGEGPVLALLPGSRRFEVKSLLPEMLGAARIVLAERPGTRVVLPVAPNLSRSLVTSVCDRAGLQPILVDGRAREVLQAADAAIVASGTATLEATLAGVPHVVSYKASWLTYLTYKFLVRTKRIALPNILAGREVVPELLQARANAGEMARSVLPLLEASSGRTAMSEGLAAVRRSLGTPGASERVAALVRDVASRSA